ncbi:MAG: hypothetical protein U0228_35790 [Myxococcaceae bacterium]
MRVAVVLALALIIAGCSERPCNGSTCPTGCCGSDGICAPGKVRTECGTGGAMCLRCSSSEECVDGQCFPLNVPDAGRDAGSGGCRCTGTCCLPDGTCAPNNEPTACGLAGQFCGQCASGQRCEFGHCLSTSCGGCFDGLGVCRTGNDVAACGRDAGVCTACLADQGCVAGTCVFTKCDSSNCRFGCCMPDKRCELAPSALACGTGGDPCLTCNADAGEQCQNGFCL